MGGESIKNGTTKAEQMGGQKTRLFGFDIEESTLPFEVADPDDVSETFMNHKLVPFAGTMSNTGDRMLGFYNRMAEETPTSSACIESKKILAFGSRFKIIKSTDSIFDIGEETEETVSMDNKKAYINFVRTVDYGRDRNIKHLSESLYEELESNGNMWLEVIMYEVGTERKVSFRRHEMAHVRYHFLTDGDYSEVAISKKWDSNYLSKNPMRFVPVYPYVMENKGTKRTMIHVKNGKKFWYGRPQSKGSLLNQYNEYQNLYYLARTTSKDFVGRIIMEVEDDSPSNNRLVNNRRDQEAGFAGTKDRFDKSFTNKAKDPSTFILMTRPPNSKPMELYQIQPNTKERFYEKMDGINAYHIIMSHNWSIRLLGGNTSSYFSTNVYLDELRVKDATTNYYLQQKVHGMVDLALKLAMEYIGIDMMDTTFSFVSPYVNILKNEQNANIEFGIDSEDSGLGFGE